MRHTPILVTGPVNSGKTTLLYTLCSRLESAGYRFGGVIQVAPLPNQEKKDWVLSDQGTGDLRLLLSTEEHPEWERYGRFWVDTQTFTWAHERIMAMHDSTDYMTFDEIGPMELEGKALHATFKAVLASYGGTVIAVVRKPLLKHVMETYGISGDNVVILHADKPWEEQLEKIVK